MTAGCTSRRARKTGRRLRSQRAGLRAKLVRVGCHRDVMKRVGPSRKFHSCTDPLLRLLLSQNFDMLRHILCPVSDVALDGSAREMRLKTIDARMESFADSCGVLPIEAHRLQDHEARYHGAEWIRRLVGKGLACNYVIGYARDQSWWTFCFDRRAQDEVATEDAEIWRIEAYDSIGRGWSDTFKYWPELDRWQRVIGEATPPGYDAPTLARC